MNKHAGVHNRRLTMAAGLTVVLVFVLIITLPFLGQPLHVDDAIFWDFAKNSLENPAQLHLSDYYLKGEDVSIFRDTHPPVSWLYLSLIMLAAGEKEMVLHAGFIVFPLIAGISMFFLARRFTRNALLATILFLSTPLVMVMSHTLMGDLPMLAFWLAATAAYIYGVDKKDLSLLLLSGLLATLAIFTGYQALALLVLLPGYALLKQGFSWRFYLPLLFPLAAFGLFTQYNLSAYGELPRFTHVQGLSVQHDDVLGRFLGTLLRTGGISIFPVLLALLFSLRRKLYLILPVVLAGSAAIAFFGYGDNLPASSSLLFTVFLTGAVMAVAAVVSELAAQSAHAIKRQAPDTDFVFLGLWMLVYMGLIIILLPHSSAKYILPILAPLILIFMRELELGFSIPSTLKTVSVITIIVTAFSALVLSVADYKLAQVYKDYSLELRERHSPEGTVWFVGEWGFRHYMESEGYRYLTSASSAPREGDIIVKPGLMDWPLSESVNQRMELIERTEVRRSLPVQNMDFQANAGFYGNHWGLLPYVITSHPVETFEVFHVGAGNTPS
ncbi:MAG: glycosyltransferase family 39 protein [Thermoleophilia bacterium]|nr:glycosyltransferase family 39 protein [Thermoleophilia bacterium]